MLLLEQPIPRKSLVLTFTRKAAYELEDRLYRLGVGGIYAGTIHALAFRLIEQFWVDRNLPHRHLTNNPARLMEEATTGMSGLPSTSRLVREAELLSADAGTTKRDVDSIVTAGDEKRHLIALALRKYEALKHKKRVLDTGDLLLELLIALDDEQYAESLRWRFAHILVDEAQDLNRAQWLVIRKLVGNRDDLCMVGDVNQAIYGWNGADPRYISEFERHFPNAARIVLSRNYRSTPEVLIAGDLALGKTDPTFAVRTEGNGRVLLRSYASAADEAQSVLWSIRAEHGRGIGYPGMAVLARTNDTLAEIEVALRQARIPVRTGRSLLQEPIVKEALRELHQARPSTRSSTCAIDLREIVSDLTARDGTAEQDSDRFEYEMERLQQLILLVEEWADERPFGTLAFFRDWLNATVRTRGGDPGDVRGGVELATFHRAKGLEWRVVFLIGLESGLVPLRRSDEDEEQRLLYVAATRAAERLFCSWAERRNGQRQQPSPCLRRMAEAVTPELSYNPLTLSQKVGELRLMLRGAWTPDVPRIASDAPRA